MKQTYFGLNTGKQALENAFVNYSSLPRDYILYGQPRTQEEWTSDKCREEFLSTWKHSPGFWISHAKKPRK
jgi:hypothetical protein